MSNRIHYIHQPSQQVGHFVRLGHTAHKQFSDWASGDVFRPSRVVANPAHIKSQARLLSVLKDMGTQLVLDTKGAELGSRSAETGTLSKLPWAKPSGTWVPDDFESTISRKRHANLIAGFSAEHAMDAIFTPANFLNTNVAEYWLPKDLQVCEALREALDESGQSGTDLIYPLVLPNAALENIEWLSLLASELRQLPISSVWLRVSGVGVSCSPSALKRAVEALDVLTDCGRPLVVDYAGGLPALTLCSIGAASGFSHGVLMKEAFRGSDLGKVQTSGNGGSAPRIYLPEAQTYLDRKQFEQLMSVPGMRSRFACQDSRCCGRQFRLMQKDARKHFIVQRQAELAEFMNVPEHRRAEHIVEKFNRAQEISNMAAQSKGLEKHPALQKKFAQQTSRFLRFGPVIKQLTQRRPMPLQRPSLPPSSAAQNSGASSQGAS